MAGKSLITRRSDFSPSILSGLSSNASICFPSKVNPLTIKDTLVLLVLVYSNQILFIF